MISNKPTLLNDRAKNDISQEAATSASGTPQSASSISAPAPWTFKAWREQQHAYNRKIHIHDDYFGSFGKWPKPPKSTT